MIKATCSYSGTIISHRQAVHLFPLTRKDMCILTAFTLTFVKIVTSERHRILVNAIKNVFLKKHFNNRYFTVASNTKFV